VKLNAVRLALCAVALGLFAGCQPTQQGPERLPVYPVRGLVTVDGLPTAGVMVRLQATEPPQGESQIYAANPTAITDADGAFALSTYTDGDGVAAGVYVVTFEWRKFDRLANGYTGPDWLEGKYSDPEKSEFSVTVTGNEETGVDLEPFALTR